jgi:hypothetical protein
MRSDSRCVVSSLPAAGVPPMRHPVPHRRSRIITVAHERLVVIYSRRDAAVYLLRPPGQEPRAVLAAARLVLDDKIYQELAAYLGLSPSWPAEREPAGQGRAG